MKGPMAFEAQRQPVVDVVSRRRFVCDVSNVMCLQIDRFAHTVLSTAVATNEVVPAEHFFAPFTMFRGEMKPLRTSPPVPVIRSAATLVRLWWVVPGDVTGRLTADQHPAAARAGRPPCAASTVPAIRTTSGTETLTSLLCLLSQDPDDSLAEGARDLDAAGAVAAMANTSSHAA